MCQPKPGPRCARSITDQIASLEKRREEDLQRFMSDPSHEPSAASRAIPAQLARLSEEFDETSTGQAALRARIAELQSPWSQDRDQYAVQDEVAQLTHRLTEATERRSAKLAALKSLQAGNEAAADLQLRYGAHAGWLAGSDLLGEVAKAEGGRVSVRPGYAVATLFVDCHDEEDGYGRPVAVKDVELAYETPLRPGPRPGTWITGDPKRGLRDGAPHLYDEQAQTLVEVDPRTGETFGEPVPVAGLEDLSVLDPYGDWDKHSEYRAAETVQVDRVRPQVMIGADGSRVLRVDVSASAITSAEYARAHYEP